jgi:hypothetical protein
LPFVLADSLVAKLDELKWSIGFAPVLIQLDDPLEEMSRTRRYWIVDSRLKSEELSPRRARRNMKATQPSRNHAA